MGSRAVQPDGDKLIFPKELLDRQPGVRAGRSSSGSRRSRSHGPGRDRRGDEPGAKVSSKTVSRAAGSVRPATI